MFGQEFFSFCAITNQAKMAREVLFEFVFLKAATSELRKPESISLCSGMLLMTVHRINNVVKQDIIAQVEQ